MMEKKNKEIEFNQFWEQHHKQLILNAPKELRDEYVESPSSILPWTGCALSCPWASVSLFSLTSGWGVKSCRGLSWW